MFQPALDKTRPITGQRRLTHQPRLTEGSVDAKRAEIQTYFQETFDLYEALFDTLANDEAFYLRPCALRHPLIFYFGHTATFFTNKLILAKGLTERINPKIESMCAIGVDEMSWDDLNEDHYDWPSVAEVRTYRHQVRATILQFIDTVDFTMPIDWASPLWPVMMGIEHERIHLETSSVLIRQLPITSVRPSPFFPLCTDRHRKAPENSLRSVPSGRVTIDHQDPAPVYGWDNEYGRHDALVAGFNAAQTLVSNQEFLPFVTEGGYTSSEFWDEEGNRWRQFSPLKHPSFWLKKPDGWHLRTMTEEIPMPWNWPVEVNFHEAAAFCRWKARKTGKAIRLPSEDEWLRLHDHAGARDNHAQANWNLEKAASSSPVDQASFGDFFDVVGNVWQWTMTPIYPFEGFKIHPLYDDFTTPTFDNQHNLIKGGSWISTGNEINGHSRYAFRRHFFQHAGFRYIESEEAVQTEFPLVETDEAMARVCEWHYGESHFGIEPFALAYAKKALDVLRTDPLLSQKPNVTALEVGCQAGRGAFELARHISQVTALDVTARLIRLAHQMQSTGTLRYALPQESELMDYYERTLASLDLQTTAPRCTFLQQDPCNLKPIFTGYDLIVAPNVLESLYDPKTFLGDLAARLNDEGLLVLTSTYQWSESATPRDQWLGGFKDPRTGENVTSFEAISAILNQAFRLVEPPTDLPWVQRKSKRHFEVAMAQVSVWKKRPEWHPA
jgi:5-histidylcysteine sulfoxide synthase/putative 4-mercaptohistidine N1-methyltranferase